MTTTTDDVTLAPASGALAALRALSAEPAASIQDALRAAEAQAQLLRDRLLPVAPEQMAASLTTLIPSILVEYIDDMPVPGISFWGNGHWHIHLRARDPLDLQLFTILHELKHIIDHPLRRQENSLIDADWEVCADHFATQVLTPRPSLITTAGERRNTFMTEPSTSNTPAKATDGTPLLLTIPEACDALRISRWSLYQLINKRRLKTVRIDRRRLVAKTDLAALVEELRAEGAADGR